MNTEIFCITTAAIIVTVRLALSYLEMKDMKAGVPVNHEEYTFKGLLKLLWKDFKGMFKKGKRHEQEKQK